MRAVGDPSVAGMVRTVIEQIAVGAFADGEISASQTLAIHPGEPNHEPPYGRLRLLEPGSHVTI
jgi:hypothetical protein